MVAGFSVWTVIVIVLLYMCGAIAAGGGLLWFVVLWFSQEPFDRKPSENWPYLSELHWLLVLLFGGLALVGLGFSMQLGVV